MPPSNGCSPRVASTEPIFADDAAAAGFLRLFDLFDDGIDELRSQQVVGPINHGQYGNVATLLARNQCILGHNVPPFFDAMTRPGYLLRPAYSMTCKMQVILGSQRPIKL